MSNSSSKKGPYRKKIWLVSLNGRYHGCSKALDNSGYLEQKGEQQRIKTSRNKIIKNNLGHERIKLHCEKKIFKNQQKRVLSKEIVVRFFFFVVFYFFSGSHYGEEIGLRVGQG